MKLIVLFLKRPAWRKISTWNKLSFIQKYKLKRTSWDEIRFILDDWIGEEQSAKEKTPQHSRSPWKRRSSLWQLQMIAGRSLPKWIEGLFRCQNFYTNHLSSCIYNYLSFILDKPWEGTIQLFPHHSADELCEGRLQGRRWDWSRRGSSWRLGNCQQRPLGLERQPEEGMGQRYIVKELSNADKSALVR